MAFGKTKDKKTSQPPRPAPAVDAVGPAADRKLQQELEHVRAELEDARTEKNRQIELSRRDREEVQRLTREKSNADQKLKEAVEARVKAESAADEARRVSDLERTRYQEKMRALTEDVDRFVTVERERRIKSVDEEIAARRSKAEAAWRLEEAEAGARVSAAETRQMEALAEADRRLAEAAETLNRARVDAFELKNKAREDSETLRRATRDEADALTLKTRTALEKEITGERAKLQAESARRLEEATMLATRRISEAEKSALERARVSESVATERERLAADLLARAESRAADAHESLRRELQARATELELGRAALEQERLGIETARHKNERRSEALEHAHATIAAEQEDLALRAAALLADEVRLGPAAVERLERRVAELEARLATVRDHHLEAAAERDRLRGEIEMLDGAGAAGRTVEVERLRARVAALQTDLALHHDDASVEMLRRQIAILEPFRDEVHGLRQQNNDLQTSQDQCDRKIREIRREVERVQREKLRVEGELNESAKELESLRSRVEATSRLERDMETLRIERDHEAIQRQELQHRLDLWNKDAKRAGQEHYGVLAKLDDNPPQTGLATPTKAPSLKELVEIVRDYAARQNPCLFYERDTIRSFIAGLASADLTLLQGPSGTGKTSLPAVIGDAIGALVFRIPVQAGWRDNTDLLGYYNAFTRTFRASKFTESLYKAHLPDFVDRPVFIVLDECNLSQMEYYFADFLSELEDWRSEPEIRLLDVEAAGTAPAKMPDGKTLKLPRNVRYFGTANQDESTCGIADKTYDRAAVLMLEERGKRYTPTSNRSVRPITWASMTDHFTAAFERMKPAETIGPFITKIESAFMKEFSLGLGNRFEERFCQRFLPVFVAAGGLENDGLDHLVRTRLLRRLDRMRDPTLSAPIRRLREVIVGEWPFSKGHPRLSVEALDRISERLG
jgi:hypothetical protein